MVKELPVIYLQAAACSGCVISVINTASPTIKNVLIDQIVPGVHINLRFHPVIMGGAGEMVIKASYFIKEGRGPRGSLRMRIRS